jgi:hypothetical protein
MGNAEMGCAITAFFTYLFTLDVLKASGVYRNARITEAT